MPCPPQSIVRTDLEVTTPGLVRLRLNATRGVSLWVDQTAAPVSGTIDLDLPRGLHTLTLALDRSQFPGDLRLTLDDAPGSPAQARPVLGP